MNKFKQETNKKPVFRLIFIAKEDFMWKLKHKIYR